MILDSTAPPSVAKFLQTCKVCFEKLSNKGLNLIRGLGKIKSPSTHINNQPLSEVRDKSIYFVQLQLEFLSKHKHVTLMEFLLHVYTFIG